MKVHVIILGFLISVISSYGQSKTTCKQILKKKITVADFQENIDEFIENFQTLVYCEFDSIDYQIFMGPQGNMPLIAQSIIPLANNPNNKNEKFTFKDLRDRLIEFKQQEEYLIVLSIVQARNEIFQKEVILQNWENDKVLLSQMGFNEIQINEIYTIAVNNENKQYPEILLIYSESLATKKEKQIAEERIRKIEQKVNPEMEEWIGGLYAYKDYYIGLKKSIELEKPALIYFNGYGCINSRAMEANILLKPEIKNYINENMILICLVVDDKTKLKESEIGYSDILGKNRIDIGNFNSEIEIKYYNSNSQPIFIKQDSDGIEISRIGYTKNIKEFEQFLKMNNQ